MSFRERVEHHDAVASTMTLARERAAAGAPTGTTVVASTQSGGRGRLGRVWHSPRGAGLWLTTVLRPGPRADGSPPSLAGLVAGVAVLGAARRLGAAGVSLKWPNDVVAGDRKLCGILIEAEGVAGPSPLLLVGIGLNLAARATLSLPGDIAGRYVGLADVAADPARVGEASALAAVLDELEAWYGRWLREGSAPVLASWRAADALRGAEVRADAPSGPIVGVAGGITDLGALRVVTARGVVELNAGEVTRLRPGG